MTGDTLTTIFSHNLMMKPPRSRDNSTTSSSSSSSSPDTPLSSCHSVSSVELTSPELKVVMLDSDPKLILRSNNVYKGSVRLRTPKTVYVSQICIKFRGVECTMVRVKEAGIDTKLEGIDKITTTYFDVETRVWGDETSAKKTNVNFPSSIDDPACSFIHYLFTAFLDGPANHPGLRSHDLVILYHPLLCAPSPTPWSYIEALYREKRTPMATVRAHFDAQVFYPDQNVLMDLDIKSDMINTGIHIKLRKGYEGNLLLQRSTVRLHIPSRLVSRAYYYIVVMMTLETGNLFISTHYMRCEISVGMANTAHDNLVHIYDLASIQHCSQSKENPYFFFSFFLSQRREYTHGEGCTTTTHGDDRRLDV
ncbi:hypothetical protein K501DRAFT_275264 [Backusella circina FSU 941]|nr:hypothetical protein K501DRAFT_275264 [Backusella circina FSU 941]